MDKVPEIFEVFFDNIKSVERLADFDQVVLNFAIDSIENLQEKLLKLGIDNPHLLATNTLKHLRSIRENDSMHSQYEEIFNQCVVLLVSYFGSAVSEIFKHYVTLQASKLNKQKDFPKEEFKFSIRELSKYQYNLKDHIGEIIVDKKNISFQDMQSISRNFKDFLYINVKKDKNVNNIILGQACRHVIVHSGAKADSSLIKQISGATPRDLKLDIKINSKIQFSRSEIEILSKSMLNYLWSLFENLDIE